MRLPLPGLVICILVRTASADCPTNTMVINPDSPTGQTITSSAPQDLEGNYVDSCAEAIGRYDLVAGEVYAYAYGWLCGGASAVYTHDVFTLLGPSSSPPITLVARAHASVTLDQEVCGGYADVMVAIREGASNSASSEEATPVDCGETVVDLDVNITRAPGETFDLYLTAQARADLAAGIPGEGVAFMTLSFPGLPAGFSVVSCQGFSAGQPVAAQPTTWGTLKAIYR